jgi:Putative restriction endonuclease
MTVAADRRIQQKPLTFDEFVAQYGDDKRYELIDGEMFDLEPTGLHEQVSGFITKHICFQIVAAQLPWIVLQRPLLRPPQIDMTAFRPDVAAIDEIALVDEPPSGLVAPMRTLGLPVVPGLLRRLGGWGG